MMWASRGRRKSARPIRLPTAKTEYNRLNRRPTGGDMKAGGKRKTEEYREDYDASARSNILNKNNYSTQHANLKANQGGAI